MRSPGSAFSPPDARAAYSCTVSSSSRKGAPTVRQRLEGERGGQPQATFFRGGKLAARPGLLHSPGRLAAPARSVEVGAVVDLCIEQVEEVEGEPGPCRDPEARLCIEDG